jgi:hypothetical protein
MPQNQLVRFSRDGDQFHYLWAARRCLHLLSLSSDLVTITIESASPRESSEQGAIEEGQAVIDVTEYYGSEVLVDARAIKYIQLKHSTVRQTEAWTPSELEHTIAEFSQRYRSLEEKYGIDWPAEKVQFWFISNRRISPKLLAAIQDVAGNSVPRASRGASKTGGIHLARRSIAGKILQHTSYARRRGGTVASAESSAPGS